MKTDQKRELDLVVISDVHLGTFGCRAEELLKYLSSIKPKTLVLNGDIIDIWQFSKHYFPKSHMQVIRYLTSLLSEGTKIYYVTGNHDEMLRKFKGFKLGEFEIVNKVVMELDGHKAWIFHGDVFDVTMKHSKWLAKLGGKGYDILIMLNTIVNWFSQKLGYGRLSFSKKIKNNVKSALKYINNFEETVAELAVFNEYDYVVCGHIHQPKMRRITDEDGKSTLYLNSGDWIENLTALEYDNKKWSIYHYNDDKDLKSDPGNSFKQNEVDRAAFNTEQLFAELLEEFNFNHIKN
jgi:UDP-2,3-diacylglucosamine pyrophosphatase LpxH